MSKIPSEEANRTERSYTNIFSINAIPRNPLSLTHTAANRSLRPATKSMNTNTKQNHQICRRLLIFGQKRCDWASLCRLLQLILLNSYQHILEVAHFRNTTGKQNASKITIYAMCRNDSWKHHRDHVSSIDLPSRSRTIQEEISLPDTSLCARPKDISDEKVTTSRTTE